MWLDGDSKSSACLTVETNVRGVPVDGYTPVSTALQQHIQYPVVKGNTVLLLEKVVLQYFHFMLLHTPTPLKLVKYDLLL